MSYAFDNDREVYGVQADTPALFERCVAELEDQKSFAWDVESSGLDPFRGARIIGHSFAWRRPSGQIAVFYVPIRHETLLAMGCNMQQLDPAMVSLALKPILEDQYTTKIGHNLQADVILSLPDDIHVAGRIFDTMTAAKLIDENQLSYKLPDCLRFAKVKHELGWKQWINPDLKDQSKQLYGHAGINRVRSEHGYKFVDPLRMGHYARQDATYELRLGETQFSLQQRWASLWKMEMDLFWCAVDMRKIGVPINKSVLTRIAEEQQVVVDTVTPKIWQLAGEEFDLGKDAQLRRILFEKLGYPTHSRTTGKWEDGQRVGDVEKVDEDALWWLHTNHGCEIAGLMRTWNKASKVLSTYTLPLIRKADSQGLLHTEFDPAGAKTGRFSCVAHWTPVITARGVLPISQVRIGDSVFTHRDRWRPIVATIIKPIDAMYDVRFSNGEVLTCTSDHRVLLATGLWATVGSIRNGGFKTLGERTAEPSTGPGGIQDFQPDCPTDCRDVEYHPPHGGAHFAELHARGRSEGTGRFAVLDIQDRNEESHDRADRQGTPTLGGGERRWEGLPHLLTQGQPGVRSSGPHDGGVGVNGSAGSNGCSPHRRRPQEQQAGQSGAGNSERAREYPQLAGPRGGIVTIEAIDYRGDFEVYDLTVAEDHSYLASGVFSHNSREPNLQNIPVRTDLGREIRSAFVARPGKVRFCLDYSQIELRLLAVLSQDRLLTQVYRDDGDVHRTTAKEVFGTDQKVGGIDMRRLAKIVNFGIPFGITEIGVQRNLNKDLPLGQLPLDEGRAKDALDGWYRKYSGVDSWRKQAWAEAAANNGLLFNMFGRPRRVPEIAAKREAARGRAERQITSTLVQGSAADLIKYSMLAAWQYVKSQTQCDAAMVLMVHDDLQFDMEYAGSASVVREIKRIMESTCQDRMSVPIKVDCEYFTDNWKNKQHLEGF